MSKKIKTNKPKLESSTLTDYKVEDLLQYGEDHLATSRFLFISHPEIKYDNYTYNTLDSAAYLGYLGIEQILKACLLWESEERYHYHGLYDVTMKIRFLKTLNQRELELIKKIDIFEKSKYPYGSKQFGNQHKSVTVSQSDIDNIIKLYNTIIKKMPDELYSIYNKNGLESLANSVKGGRKYHFIPPTIKRR